MSVRSQVVKSRNSESSNPSRCSYATSDNRRCTMLRHATHPSLCLFHAREERHLIEADRIGPELASISGDFRTVTDINHALAKLWELLSHDRISRKRAGTLHTLRSHDR